MSKHKLGGLTGISELDNKNKEKELKSYLVSRWSKGAVIKRQDSAKRTSNLNKSSLLNNKTLNNSTRNLSNSRNSVQNNGLKTNVSGTISNTKDANKIDGNSSGRYTFEKPKKLTKEEKDKIEREHAINAAKSFSLKNFTSKINKGKSSNRNNTSVPDVIYEDSELNKFPEFDTEFMTNKTLESLITYLGDVITAKKAGSDLKDVNVIPAKNDTTGAVDGNGVNNASAIPNTRNSQGIANAGISRR